MLANVQKMLDKASVQAPFSGVIAQRQVSAGDVVSPGAALFTVVDPGSMQLEASVPADQMSQVHVGMAVDFKVTGYPNRSFTGHVVFYRDVARGYAAGVSDGRDDGRLLEKGAVLAPVHQPTLPYPSSGQRVPHAPVEQGGLHGEVLTNIHVGSRHDVQGMCKPQSR